ncbi:MAG: hypothetical protein Q8O40_00145 [Chloroflexota bacterium]|nr:hypothetical protein [Chloroflexota bacterium]
MGTWDVFLRDRQAGTTINVSTGLEGAPGNAIISGDRPDISCDGRYVVFESEASNLVAGDANGARDIFLWDRETGQMELISVNSDEEQSNHQSYGPPAVTCDGRFVVFQSLAYNLVPWPTDRNGSPDIYVRDRQAQTTELIRWIAPGLEDESSGEAGSGTLPDISDDGRFVVFRSTSSKLVANDTNDSMDFFVRDRVFSSDGANTGAATSSPFSVSKKLPQATITFPDDGSAFRPGQLVWLRGVGFDSDDGFLTDVAMQWSSSLDGPLGAGDDLPLTGMSQGTHTVTLTATDSDGNQASDGITIQIVATPLSETPPTPTPTPMPASTATATPVPAATPTPTSTSGPGACCRSWHLCAWPGSAGGHPTGSRGVVRLAAQATGQPVPTSVACLSRERGDGKRAREGAPQH